MAGKGDSREVHVRNEAGFKVEVYWINRWKNDELVLNTEEGIFHGAETVIKSFVSHEFQLKEIPSKKTGRCRGENDECREGYFQVTEYEGQGEQREVVPCQSTPFHVVPNPNLHSHPTVVTFKTKLDRH